MEASSGSSMAGGVSDGVADQRRLLHIIYFISRRGRIEQPHLIRVHHLQKNGVLLRDVKRWLAELRGNEMPEMFSWSYKRKYRNGYVWQDLKDDELIIPTCDNEYVLKGSEFSIEHESKHEAASENADRNESQSNVSSDLGNGHRRGDNLLYCPRISTSRKSSSDIYDMSPAFSSDHSTLTEEKGIPDKKGTANLCRFKLEHDSHSHYCSIFLKDVSSVGIDAKTITEDLDTPNSSSSSSSLLPKSKSFRSLGTAKIFRSMMRCGAENVSDSVLPAINKVDAKPSNDELRNIKTELSSSRKLRKSSTRNIQLPPEPYSRNYEGFVSSKKEPQSAAGLRSAGAPMCTQCGNSFKPEKLSKHMKSCKVAKPSLPNKAETASHKILFS